MRSHLEGRESLRDQPGFERPAAAYGASRRYAPLRGQGGPDVELPDLRRYTTPGNRGQEGQEQVLLRNDLESLESAGRSLMPDGMEKDLSKQDLADLLAYLGESQQEIALLRDKVPMLLGDA